VKRALVVLIALAAAACTPAPMPADVAAANAASSASPAPPPALPPPELDAPEPVANDLGTPVADGWVGEWRGPEGTSLRIRKQEVGYELVITNLDGPREFPGVAADEVIEFERDGVTETLRAGNGDATGMKWLAGKKDCLLLRAGEGWCRD
jgi:hypothetical protein